MSASVEGAGAARILDRGYRPYDGPRLGPGHAMRSLLAHTLRRILGLHRPARSKILPIMSIAFAYLPATVFVGVVALFGRFGAREQARRVVPRYAASYGFILSAILLFVTFVAPEALCSDRRSKSLSLYLASPLTRMTYLVSKVSAVAIVIGFVTIGPPLLLLLGLTLQDSGPHGFGGVLLVFARILASGAMLAALFTSVSMGVASLTDRRAVAAASTLLLLVGSGIVAGTLHAALGLGSWVLGISLTAAPFDLIIRIFGERTVANVPTIALVLGVAGWTALGAGLTIGRYRRLQITR